ncbi:MAG: membrane-bound lytic murein transglycosylase MltF [Halioglobus sp.]
MRKRATTLLIILLCAVATQTGGCSRQDSLERILTRGELLVVSRNSPTTFFLDKSGPTGFEYALTDLLAADLGVTLSVTPEFSLEGIFNSLLRGDADLAAAGLTLTAQRAARFPHSLPYDTLVTQVVYRAGKRRPRNVEDLVGRKIVTLADSSHAETLQQLRAGPLPDLTWDTLPEAGTMQLLHRVREGSAELALIDSGEFAVQQGLFPRLKVAFDLGEEEQMVWYLPPGGDHHRLLERINALLLRIRNDGTLARLRDIHFGHAQSVSRLGSHTFMRKMTRALPPYRDLIQEVADEYQVDWHLLAAVAYQESHWNPKAESPTGVRGMMMLTLPTAREMGVDNRLSADQSLRGGARYLKNIKRRLPKDIYEPDRTWMALAAYNIGMGHLEDARVLTERQGGDPHLWQDVMQRLPLLEKKNFYHTLRHGFARGTEAVTYVQNIRHYYSILQWQDIPDNHALPPLKPEDYLPDVLQNLSLKML